MLNTPETDLLILFLHGQGHGSAEDIAHFERKKGATRAPKPPPKPKEKQGGGMYLVVEQYFTAR